MSKKLFSFNVAIAGLAVFLFISGCQKEISLETGRMPGDEVCGRITAIHLNPGTESENQYQFIYNEAGKLTGIYDSVLDENYALEFDASNRLLKKTSPSTETVYSYDSRGRLETIAFNYPLLSRYEFEYGAGELPEAVFFYQEKNGALALMHQQMYRWEAGNIRSVDYDSIGIVRQDFFETDPNLMFPNPLLSLLSIGSRFSFGMPEPFAGFSKNFLLAHDSRRFNNQYSILSEESSGKIISYTITDKNNLRKRFEILYNCL